MNLRDLELLENIFIKSVDAVRSKVNEESVNELASQVMHHFKVCYDVLNDEEELKYLYQVSESKESLAKFRLSHLRANLENAKECLTKYKPPVKPSVNISVSISAETKQLYQKFLNVDPLRNINVPISTEAEELYQKVLDDLIQGGAAITSSSSFYTGGRDTGPYEGDALKSISKKSIQPSTIQPADKTPKQNYRHGFFMPCTNLSCEQDNALIRKIRRSTSMYFS